MATQRRLLLRAGVLGAVRAALAARCPSVIATLTAYVTKAHLARAALEATAWQVADILMAGTAVLVLALLGRTRTRTSGDMMRPGRPRWGR